MHREFLTHNEENDDDHLMESIAAREQELASYDSNVSIYAYQLEVMRADTAFPNSMPPEMVALTDKPNEQIMAMGATEADAKTASQVNHLRRVETLFFTEQAERRKSELAYQALLEKLPAGVRRDAALARYLAKEAARKAML